MDDSFDLIWRTIQLFTVHRTSCVFTVLDLPLPSMQTAHLSLESSFQLCRNVYLIPLLACKNHMLPHPRCRCWPRSGASSQTYCAG